MLDSATRSGAFASFLLLYVTLYAAFGAISPFLPSILSERGLAPEQIGLVLASGAAIRLVSAPIAGQLADRLQAAPTVLMISMGCSSIVVVLYLMARGPWPLLAVGMLHAAALAPLTPLLDALSLNSATRHDFQYGSVRGAGSAAFIVGVLVSGSLADHFGLSVTLWLNAGQLGVAALRANPMRKEAASLATPLDAAAGGVAALLRIKLFRRVILIAALVLGSHALHDGFAVIRWRAAGISNSAISILWSEAVASEVMVFLFLGEPLLRRLGPAGCAALASGAGILRWLVISRSVAVPAIAIVEPLHGLTFALLHLACMQLIVACAPRQLAATAQTLYGAVGIGLASALLTFLSGPLYARLGGEAFWVMAALCAVALPLTLGLREAHPT